MQRTLEIEAVVVADRNTQGIGCADQLLWKLPKDMERFRKITKGHAVFMGTKTALSIGRALPGRTNFVLTTRGVAPYPNQHAVSSLQEAVNHLLAVSQDRITKLFVCGGEEVYRYSLPYLTGLHLTTVFTSPSKRPDRFFPLDEYEILHGRIDLSQSHWEDDGINGEIRTRYNHKVHRAPVGPPLLSLPKDCRLGRLALVDSLAS
jgi:dihydrofolate reductase